MEGLQNFDFAVLDWVSKNLRCGFLDAALPMVTFLGNGGWFFILTALVLICTKKYRRLGIAVGLALIFGLLIGNLTLKPLIARTRPYDVRPYIELLISKPRDFSFPSGHTLASFEAASVLMLGDKRLGIPYLILAALIAFSRIYLYVHYPSDVLCGMILGTLFGVVATAVVKRLFAKKDGCSKGLIC